MRTLFELSVQFLSRNFAEHVEGLSALPPNCKELVIDWMVSHDLLCQPQSYVLLANPSFVRNLSQVQFFLSDEISDEHLRLIGSHNNRLQKIVLVHCSLLTDQGVLNITHDQPQLCSLELRGLKQLTSQCLKNVWSPVLTNLDLSDCARICSAGLVDVLSRNPMLTELYLNNCKSLDDVAIYAIASYCGQRLRTLQLDFLTEMRDPAAAIAHLTTKCSNLTELSLCRYFDEEDFLENEDEEGPSTISPRIECELACAHLQDLDLYGNYFTVLPQLPANISTLRLSCTGDENIKHLKERLSQMHKLTSFQMVLSCGDGNDETGEKTRKFMCELLPEIGDKLTGLQLHCDVLVDAVLTCINHNCPRVRNLCLDVDTLSSRHLFKLLSNDRTRAKGIRSLRMSRCKVTWRVLFTIARWCSGLQELEMSYMHNVDDRFLKLLGHNCADLRNINFNGCHLVKDEGICALARGCTQLREVRVRATSITDHCIYCLAQFCPQLQWIAHADYTGTPNFSQKALNKLRDSCTSRVIC